MLCCLDSLFRPCSLLAFLGQFFLVFETKYSLSHLTSFQNEKRPPQEGERYHGSKYNAVSTWAAFRVRQIVWGVWNESEAVFIAIYWSNGAVVPNSGL